MTVTDKREFSETLERFNSITSISAEYIFEYESETGVFILYKNTDGRFFEVLSVENDFENYAKNMGMIYPDDNDSFEQVCDNVRSGNDRAAFEIRFTEPGEDDYQWYRLKMKTITDEHNHNIRVIGKLENISDIKNAEKRLIDKAERDPLTKIYNKSTTKKLIKNYLRSDTKDTFDAFMIIDVDNFKQVNDTLGHLFGDSILVDLSQEMQELFRANDVVGRIGGDEFLVFLRGMKNKTHIEAKAGDVCKIFDLLYAGEDGTKITGSLGIALYPQDGDTFDELYRKADLALYASKRAGKSCYTFYSSEYEEKSEPSLLPRIEQYRRNLDFLRLNTDFNISILRAALDFNEENVDNEIYDLLYKVGKHYNLSRVSVYEYIEDEDVYKVTEQWNGKYATSTVNHFFKPSDHAVHRIRADFDDNGIFISDLSHEKSNTHECFLKQHDTKSCISCGYFRDGRLMGFVSFEECISPRIWSIDEAKSVISLAKVIFMHYMRIKRD